MRAAYWWIDRWRQSSAYIDMTAEEQGLYRNLLDEVWLRPDGVIPDRSLARASGDPEAWARCSERVLRWMQRAEGGWTHETALEVIRSSQTRADRQKRYRERHTERNAGRNARRNEGRSPDQDQDQDQNSGSGTHTQSTSPATGSVPGAGAPECVSEPEPDPLPSKSTRKRRAAVGDHPEFIAWFEASYRECRGSPYMGDYDRDGPAVSRLLRKGFTPDELRRRAALFLRTDEPFISRTDRNLAVFAMKINDPACTGEVIQAARNDRVGYAAPSRPEEFRNGEVQL